MIKLKDLLNEESAMKAIIKAPKGTEIHGGGYSHFTKLGHNSWKNYKTKTLAHDKDVWSRFTGFRDFELKKGKVKYFGIGGHQFEGKLTESYNQSDVNYAMKMAFDSIPGNWHKALKRVKYSKRNKAIKLNMSSYMGPGKVLQKIVNEFNRSMGTKYKIDKDSFVKGSITSIELREK